MVDTLSNKGMWALEDIVREGVEMGEKEARVYIEKENGLFEGQS